MSAVLVTGGTGDLGSALVHRLVKADHPVRIMSRRPGPAHGGVFTEWAQAKLSTGEGLAEAVAGIDVIAHCASSPFRKTAEVDVEGTRRLLEEAKRQDVSHFLYISIVGIDRIPFPYYNEKLAAEKVIEESGVPCTILRATQFHRLIDRFFGEGFLRFPVGAIPGSFKYQTIDTGEVADRMAELIAAGPSGRAPDIGGPEVLTAGQMVKPWLKARRARKLVLPLPVFGKVARGFKRGDNCCPDQKYGKVTWQEWLDQRYGGESA